MQEIIGVIVVNIINAVIVLGGAYAVYFINRLCAYVKTKIDSEAVDKALNALYRTTSVTVSALEQTVAKALREDVKYSGASKDELKALAEKAYEEITAVLENEYLRILQEETGDLEKYIKNLIEQNVLEIKRKGGY